MPPIGVPDTMSWRAALDASCDAVTGTSRARPSDHIGPRAMQSQLLLTALTVLTLMLASCSLDPTEGMEPVLRRLRELRTPGC